MELESKGFIILAFKPFENFTQMQFKSIVNMLTRELTYMLLSRVLVRHTKSNHILAAHHGRNHVVPASVVDLRQELSVYLVRISANQMRLAHCPHHRILSPYSLKSEADESQVHIVAHLEPVVQVHQRLKVLGQPDVIPHVALQSLDAVRAQHKPQL